MSQAIPGGMGEFGAQARIHDTNGPDSALTVAGVPLRMVSLTGYLVPGVAAQMWLMVFDTDSVPPNGSKPLYPIQLTAPTSGGSFAWAPKGGQVFYKGLYAALSSTGGTFTADASKVVYICARTLDHV